MYWASFNLAKDVNLLADELENEREKRVEIVEFHVKRKSCNPVVFQIYHIMIN